MKSRPRGLIVALDGSPAFAREIVQKLGGAVDFYKVPPALTLEDPGFINWLKEKRKRVFLDCKWYDIPSQVKRSVESAGRLGVTAATVHAAGGREMMAAALSARPRPWIWGVTVLTSQGPRDLREAGAAPSPARQVLRLARLARRAGLEGLVCSPRELSLLRKSKIALDLITPGIQFGGRGGEDQSRTAGPREAWSAGADYIVVGRSILESPDPAGTARAILALR
jgi:orotidine-5'-phosphate decarboxylase